MDPLRSTRGRVTTRSITRRPRGPTWGYGHERRVWTCPNSTCHGSQMASRSRIPGSQDNEMCIMGRTAYRVCTRARPSPLPTTFATWCGMGYQGATVPGEWTLPNMTKLVIWDDHPGDDSTMVRMSGSTSGGPDDPCHVDEPKGHIIPKAVSYTHLRAHET